MQLQPAGKTARDREERDTRSILEALRWIVRELRLTARAAERRHGVSAAQIFVLHLLGREGAMSVNELAERTFTHQSSVSVVVARLADAGLVARGRAEDDRRRTDVALTAKGRALLRRVPEPAQARLLAALARIPARQREALSQGLAALVHEMGIARGAAGMFFEDGARA
ncbi:MAG: MarR family transcriptional regulator, partial [Thermodesulfobacteriota bacterium]